LPLALGWCLVLGLCLVLGTLTAHAQQAKTKLPAFDLVISNTACFSGNGLDPYARQASVQRANVDRSSNPREGAPQFVAVPATAWRGLTITGFGLYYEQTAVLFREPLPVVRRVLRRNGVRIERNGNIPINNDEAVEVQSVRAVTGPARAYGASEVVCGV
jgi:hypothetical protein